MVKKVRKKVEPEKLLRLDLACGSVCMVGFDGVDIVPGPGVIHVVDLLKFPWPFKDESVEVINCSHFVEHIPLENIQLNGKPKDMFFAFFDECYRILTTGGRMTVLCPWYASVRASQDPTHRRFISDVTFAYLNKEWRKNSDIGHYNVACDFDFVPSYVVKQEFAARHEEQRSFAMQHYMNSVVDIQALLTKRPKE